MTTATAVMCRDERCTDGLTHCHGCNGYGVLTMGGKRYKLRSGGKNIGATAVPHSECGGSGMVPCKSACVVLDAGELAAVGRGPDGALAAPATSPALVSSPAGRNVWTGATTAGYDS